MMEETDWCQAQLRVVYRLIEHDITSGFIPASDYHRVLSILQFDLGLLPGCSMLAFWVLAIRNREAGSSIAGWISEAYHRADGAASFRHVAFPGYKAKRNYTPRGKGKR
jgi:hypothetical protein